VRHKVVITTGITLSNLTGLEDLSGLASIVTTTEKLIKKILVGLLSKSNPTKIPIPPGHHHLPAAIFPLPVPRCKGQK